MFGEKRRLKDKIEELERENQRLNRRNVELREAADKTKQEYEIKEKKAVAALEAKHEKEMNKTEKKWQERIYKMREDLLKEREEFIKKVHEENYENLTGSLRSLHEEGNVTTKTIKEFALKSLESVKANHNYNNQIGYEEGEE